MFGEIRAEAASPGRRQDVIGAWVRMAAPTGLADGWRTGEWRSEPSTASTGFLA